MPARGTPAGGGGRGRPRRIRAGGDPIEPVTERVRIIGAQPAGAVAGTPGPTEETESADVALFDEETDAADDGGDGPSAPSFDLFGEDPEAVARRAPARPRRHPPRRGRARRAVGAQRRRPPRCRSPTGRRAPSRRPSSPTCRTGPIRPRGRSRPCSTAAARTTAPTPRGRRRATRDRRGVSTATSGTTAPSTPLCSPTTRPGWAPSRRRRWRSADRGSSTISAPPPPIPFGVAEPGEPATPGSWWSEGEDEDEDEDERPGTERSVVVERIVVTERAGFGTPGPDADDGADPAERGVASISSSPLRAAGASPSAPGRPPRPGCRACVAPSSRPVRRARPPDATSPWPSPPGSAS